MKCISVLALILPAFTAALAIDLAEAQAKAKCYDGCQPFYDRCHDRVSDQARKTGWCLEFTCNGVTGIHCKGCGFCRGVEGTGEVDYAELESGFSSLPAPKVPVFPTTVPTAPAIYTELESGFRSLLGPKVPVFPTAVPTVPVDDEEEMHILPVGPTTTAIADGEEEMHILPFGPTTTAIAYGAA